MLHPGCNESKLIKWQDSLPPGHPKKAPDYHDFIKYFSCNERETGGMDTATRKLYVTAAPVVATEEKSQKERAHPEASVKFSQEKLDRAQEIIYDAWKNATSASALSPTTYKQQEKVSAPQIWQNPEAPARPSSYWSNSRWSPVPDTGCAGNASLPLALGLAAPFLPKDLPG